MRFQPTGIRTSNFSLFLMLVHYCITIYYMT